MSKNDQKQTQREHMTLCIECVTCTLFIWVENIHDIQGEFNKQQQSTTTIKYYPYFTEGTHDSVHRVHHFHFVYVVLFSLGQCIIVILNHSTSPLEGGVRGFKLWYYH